MCDLCRTSKPVQDTGQVAGSPKRDALDALDFALTKKPLAGAVAPSPFTVERGVVYLKNIDPFARPSFSNMTVREAIQFARDLDQAILDAERQAAAYARDSRQALIGS